METEKEYIYGLLGRNISYSFSREYFTGKFSELGMTDHDYVNFDLPEISELPPVLDQYKGKLKGFNITIPYKQEIFDYLDETDQIAADIGAVNVVKIIGNTGLKGFNTDSYGFEHSIRPLLKPYHKKALILGTGGASKAVSYVLKKLGIEYLSVSRNPGQNQISYGNLTGELLKDHLIIINATPVGTYPDIDKAPEIDYKQLTSKHLLYDLIYNPPLTTFLRQGKSAGAMVKNGLEMLELQAEKAWEIWNS
jgi:shikimate dehydrogenase